MSNNDLEVRAADEAADVDPDPSEGCAVDRGRVLYVVLVDHLDAATVVALDRLRPLPVADAAVAVHIARRKRHARRLRELWVARRVGVPILLVRPRGALVTSLAPLFDRSLDSWAQRIVVVVPVERGCLRGARARHVSVALELASRTDVEVLFAA